MSNIFMSTENSKTKEPNISDFSFIRLINSLHMV